VIYIGEVVSVNKVMHVERKLRVGREIVTIDDPRPVLSIIGFLIPDKLQKRMSTGQICTRIFYSFP